MRKSVHVTYRKDDGKWHVVNGDTKKSKGNYSTQKEAMKYGRKLAMETSSEFLIHGKDGKIRLATSYGNDPQNSSSSSKSKSSSKSASNSRSSKNSASRSKKSR